jgi:polar amino acid transport system substrate-binding protein
MNKAILIAAAFGTLLTTAALAAPVRIATEGAYAPFNYVDDTGKPAGFEIDLGTEICTRAGLECTFQTNEWDSIIPNLVAGNYDVIMASMSITDERKQTIDFSDAYFPPDPSKYVARAGTSLDFNALSGKAIGVQSATIQASFVEETFGASNTVKAFDTADKALADLGAGNIDIFFGDGTYVDEVVTSSSGALEATGPDVILGDGIGAGVRKGDADLKAKLDDTIKAMKADGSLEALILKWFPDRKTPIFAN